MTAIFILILPVIEALIYRTGSMHTNHYTIERVRQKCHGKSLLKHMMS